MSSANKQQKRAKRAKAKAKQARIERQHPHAPLPIVPDYFMPDFPDDEDLDDETLLQIYVDPETLDTMDEEEREDMKALLRGDMEGMATEDEMLLDEVYQQPAPEPTESQRIAHYEELRQAELLDEDALLSAFARGPIAANALHNIDFNDYETILINTLGAYWKWAHGLDEQAIRARIVNDDFYEAFRDALGAIEDEQILQMLTTKKDD